MLFFHLKKLVWKLRQMQHFFNLKKTRNKKLSQICIHFQTKGVGSQN